MYMSLSNTTKVHILDPQVFNSKRCEFRIPDGNYASALRLIDLGLYSTQVGAADGVYPSRINGVLGCCKKLTLYSDSVTLDEAQKLQAWGSSQTLRTTNQGSEDINRFELHNGINLSLNGTGSYTYEASKKDYRQSDSGDVQRQNNMFQISSTENDGNSGAVNLADYLEFLASVPILPSIPNLRLLIEWNTATTDLFNDPSSTGGAVANLAVLPIRPSLIVEEILGMKSDGNIRIPYLQTIVESLYIDENSGATLANGTVYKSNLRSGAFKGRYLKDLLFFNESTQLSPIANSWTNGSDFSPAMDTEKIQLIVNGRKYLPDQGIDQEAQKLQYFNSTFGPLNIPLAAALPTLTDGSGNVIDDNNVVGRYSITGVEIEDNIERLEIEYTRTGNTAVPAQSEPFNLLLFGRCARLLEIKNGKLRLSY